MRRRRLLAALGSAAAVGSAGCLGLEAPAAFVTPGDSRFAPSVDPPPWGPTTRWVHRADPGTDDLLLLPSRERLDLPGTVAFRLVNATDAQVEHATELGLYRRHRGFWHPLDAREMGVFSEHHDRGFEVEFRRDAEGDPPFWGPLGGGSYALVVFARGGTGDRFEGGDQAGVLLALDAPPLTLEPTDDLTVDRDGGVVTVTSPRWEEWGHGNGVLRVERVADRVTCPATREAHVLPEEVARSPARNALAFVEEGVEAVRLRTDRSVAREAARSLGDRFCHRGLTLAASWREP